MLIAEQQSGMTRRGAVYEYIRTHPGARPGIAKETPPRDGGPAISHLLVGEARLREDEEERILPLRLPAMVFQGRAGVLLGVLTQETPRRSLCLLHVPHYQRKEGLAKELGHHSRPYRGTWKGWIQTGLVCKEEDRRGIAIRWSLTPTTSLAS